MLYINPNKPGKALIGQVDEQTPYPGAKIYYLISCELLENSEWLPVLIKTIQEELLIVT